MSYGRTSSGPETLASFQAGGPLWVLNGPEALEMRCPLLSRKQTSIGRRRKVGFLDLIPKSLRTNQDHRS
jgi:hypothetical protein